MKAIYQRSKSGCKLVTAIVIASAWAACKPAAEDSNVQSLDNFTAEDGAFTFNSCSGDHQVQVSDAQLVASSSEKDAIRAALSAVPVELQTAFFETMKGKFAVVSDINSSCRVSANQGGKDATLACWQPGASDVVVYIKKESTESETIRNIRHSVVRSMGYVLTDVVAKLVETGNGSELQENADFDSLKAEVGGLVVQDLLGSGTKIPALYSNDRKAWNSAAFAEAFDSWYCSNTSRSKMLASFPKTHGIFQDIAADLPEGLTQEASQYQEVAAGLGLWGRWGGGNGPVRQGLRNWGNFRANGGGLMNFRRSASGGGLVFRRPWFNPAKWQ